MGSVRWWFLPVLAAALPWAAQAQVEGADYRGAKMCSACHKALNAAVVEAYPKTAHAQTMKKVGDATPVADFAGGPFPKDKVAYVLGLGRHEQAYLDADLKVLPGVWRVGEKKWVPQDAVDGATECVGCHTTGFDPVKKTWKDLGVGCESCHGPGSKHMAAKKDDKKSTIVVASALEPKNQAMICGQCHSAGRSLDGKYAYPQGCLPGKDPATVFADAKPTQPGRNQQYSELLQSPKHWDNGVACVKCHDPHGDTGQPAQLRMAVSATCLQCHEQKVKSLPEHVAAKGKTAPADATCATCHMPNGQHLFDTKHMAAG